MYALRRWVYIGSKAVLGFALVYTVVAGVFADARSDYLVRLLNSSSQFRVRAQAAISLGSVSEDPVVVKVLCDALKDVHPAVRAASASSLERIGDSSALPALQGVLQDEESAVREAIARAIAAIRRRGPKNGPINSAGLSTPGVVVPPKYYVGIGTPGSRVSSIDKDALLRSRVLVENIVREIQGVVLAPENEGTANARLVLKAKNLTGFFLDSSIVSFDELPEGGVRAVVSVVVGTYPERNIKMILQGSAKVMGSADATAKTQAIEAAFRSALRQLPQAFILGNR